MENNRSNFSQARRGEKNEEAKYTTKKESTQKSFPFYLTLHIIKFNSIHNLQEATLRKRFYSSLRMTGSKDCINGIQRRQVQK